MEGSKTKKKRKRSSSGAKKDEEKYKTKRQSVDAQGEEDGLEMRLKALHAEAERAVEELDWFEASDKWTSLLALSEGHTGDRWDQLQAAALRGRCQVSLKLKRFERAVDDGQRLVELAGHQDVESHLLLSRALFLSALRQEESVAWTGSRIRPYERQRHLKLYQQAYDTLHHATQLYPDSEERLNREAEVIKPHLEWLTALPDELCIKVFGFLSKKQLHKVSRVCRHWYRLASDDSIWRPLVHEYEPEAQIHNDAVGQDYAWKRTYERLTRDWQIGEQMSSTLTELFSPCRFISTRFERVQPNQLLSLAHLTEDLSVPLQPLDEAKARTLLEKIVVDHVAPIGFMAFGVGEWLQHLWDLMPPPRRFFSSLSTGAVRWHNGARIQAQVWVCVTPLYFARVFVQ